MQPGTLPLALRRNAVAAMRLVLFTLDEGGAEVPMDLTGYSLRLQVRLYQGQQGAPLLDLSTGNGQIEITTAASGEVVIDWPAILALIAALPTSAEAGDPAQPRVDTFAYDLLLIAADGSAQAILEGPVPISFGVTRNG